MGGRADVSSPSAASWRCPSGFCRPRTGQPDNGPPGPPTIRDDWTRIPLQCGRLTTRSGRTSCRWCTGALKQPAHQSAHLHGTSSAFFREREAHWRPGVVPALFLGLIMEEFLHSNGAPQRDRLVGTCSLLLSLSSHSLLWCRPTQRSSLFHMLTAKMTVPLCWQPWPTTRPTLKFSLPEGTRTISGRYVFPPLPDTSTNALS